MTPSRTAPAVPSALRYDRFSRHVLREQARRGELLEVRSGVFVPCPAANTAGEARQAEVLALVRGVAEKLTTPFWFSHTTAALLWGCWTWRLAKAVEITQLDHPTIRRATERDLLRHWTALPRRDRCTVGGLPVVGLERTVVDCARSLPLDSALVVADSALRLGADPTLIGRILAESQGKRGVRQARLVVMMGDARSQSPGESLLRYGAWAAGLPALTPQVRVETAVGVYWIDAGWPDLRVGVEFDGEVKYGGRYGDPAVALRAEKRRHDALVNAGWWVVRVGWPEVTDSETLATILRRARSVRGGPR